MQQRRRVAGALLAAVVLASVMLMPGGQVASQADTEANGITFATYNIKHAQGNDECEEATVEEGDVAQTQCAVDLQRTADAIESLDADVVAVQEVDRFWGRSGTVDQEAELGELLDMETCYGANLVRAPGETSEVDHEYGTLILSSFPITSCENTFLPTPEDWEQRGLLEARIDVDGTEIAVLNTHLQAGREGEEDEAIRQRTEQADAIADRVAEIDVPVVLLGDFNAEPGDPELEMLLSPDAGLQDTWEVGGDGSDGFTSSADPVDEPEVRIDLILASSEWTVEETSVIVDEDTRIASDHYPVVTTLSLDDASTPLATPDGPIATPVVG